MLRLFTIVDDDTIDGKTNDSFVGSHIHTHTLTEMVVGTDPVEVEGIAIIKRPLV